MRFFTASTKTNHSGQHREPEKLKPSSRAKQKMRLGNNFLSLTFSVHSHDTSLCQSASCLRFAERECCADTDRVGREAVVRDTPISTGWGSCLPQRKCAYHQHQTNKLKIKYKPITLTPASARSCCTPGPQQDAAPRHRRCSSS
jgi:hypothetical protein